jgi:hypothetical protein
MVRRRSQVTGMTADYHLRVYCRVEGTCLLVVAMNLVVGLTMVRRNETAPSGVSVVPMRLFFRIRMLLAAAFLLWAGLSSGIPPLLADWRLRAARGGEPDVVERETRRYAPLVASLPVGGIIGYLPPARWPATDEARRFFLAQYALTPRIVVIGTTPEFVIVVPEVSLEGGDSPGGAAHDPRLAGFVLFQRLSNGIQVFRRFE